MACTFATESTNDTLVNSYSHCLVQLVQGLTPGDTIGSIKLGLHSTSSVTFRLAVNTYVSDTEFGSQVAYMESSAISASAEVVQFTLDTPYTIPSGVTKLYIIITASPNANYSQMFLYTPGANNSGYTYSVNYTNIGSTTGGYSFSTNESLIHSGLCTTSPTPSASARLPPPPIILESL